MLVLAGIVLGILSRVDETTGLTLGASEHAAWVLAPFVAGALSRRAEDGLLVLTVANVAYYAWMLATEGELSGPVGHWFLAGWAAGLVFGALGAWFARGARVPAAALVAAVIAADALGGFGAILP